MAYNPFIMKLLFNISCWAKIHSWPSRIMIVLSHLLLTIFALKIGVIFTDARIILPSFIFLGAGLLFGIALVTYPSKKEKLVKSRKWQLYRRRKIADLVLISSTFIMLVQLGNNLSNQTIQPLENMFGTKAIACYVKVNGKIVDQSEMNESKPIISHPRKFGLKEKRNTIKAMLGNLFPEKYSHGQGGKTGLGILLILGSIALVFLIAALACELSCSGAEGAAVLVGVLGAAGIAFLVVKAIQMMGRKNNGLNTK